MSGIYIPGMEMPKACVFCELYESDMFWCSASREEIDCDNYESVASFCPLVPIPKHGRLIDADVLRVYMLDEHYHYKEVILLEDIENAPTVIPADREVDE